MKNLLKNFYIFLTSFLFIFLLTWVWFRDGYVLATGESGIFFYNFTNIIHTFGQTWFAGAIGFPGTGLPLINLPFFEILNFLHTLGISYVVLQRSLFLFLQLTGFLSVFYMTYRLFSQTPEKKRFYMSFTAAIFYFFNQINIVLVLNRFQYPFMFFYAALPLILYIFLIALEKRKILFSILIPVVAFIFSPAFGSMPSILLFWSILLGVGIYHFLFQSRTKNTLQFLAIFFVISGIVWLAINSWWIISFVNILFSSPYVSQIAYNLNDDMKLVSALSNVLGNLSYVFRLMHHDYYIWMKDVWNGYYQNSLVIIVSFIPPIFVFGSLLTKKKFPFYYLFIFFALIAIFFIKGVADPFGGFFYFLFTHARLLEGFRNPFEKIGIILPVFYSIPFAYGLFAVYDLVKNKFSKFFAWVFVGIVFFACFGILCFPLINGEVFLGNTVPSSNPKIGFKVQVPDYYMYANTWLNSKGENFRVIALPIGGEGITYAWKYGYRGVEVSNGLFDKPFISYCTTIQFLCELSQELQPLTLRYPQALWKVFSPLDVRYIMLRKDTNYSYDQMQNPNDLEPNLSSALHKDKKFGPLTFYSVNNDLGTPKIFAGTQGIYIFGLTSFLDTLPLANFQKGDIYVTDTTSQYLTFDKIHQIILQAKEFVPPLLTISKENALLELPYVRFLPGSPFYLWTRVKELFTDYLAGNSDFLLQVEQSDKRLVEVYKLLSIHKIVLAEKTMHDYLKLLLFFSKNTSHFSQDKMKEDLLRQKYVLTDIVTLAKNNNDNDTVYNQANSTLEVILKEVQLQPLLPSDIQTDRIYIVRVQNDGSYTLKLSKKDYEKYYPTKIIEGVIDGNMPFAATEFSDDFITLGTFSFHKGEHQINIHVPEQKNLLTMDTMTISTKKIQNQLGMQSQAYSLPVENFDPFGRYIVSFDYKIESGNPFQVRFIEDTDLVRYNKVIPHYSLSLNYTGHKNTWYHYEIPIIPNKVAHSAKVVIFIYPGNICIDEKHPETFQKCKNNNFKKQFDVASIP